MNKIINIIDRVGKFFSVNFYILHILLAWLMMKGVSLDFGVVITFFVFYYSLRNLRITSRFGYLILFYIFYLLLTGLSYFYNGRPIILYFDGIKSTILPSLFFFVGLNKRNEMKMFWNKTLIGITVCFIFGLYLYFYSPSWYVSWKIRELESWLGAYSEFYTLEVRHLSAFWPHSYFTGYMAFVVLSIQLVTIKQKGVTFGNILSFLIIVLVLFLAQQRVSIILGILLIILTHIWGAFKKVSSLNKLFFIQLFIFSSFVYYFLDSIFLDVYELIFKRISTIVDGGAFAERNSQWIRVLDDQTNFLYGHGFNSGGGYAANLGYVGVNDGEFIKFLYEGGIIGVSLFLLINILTIIRGIRNYKYCQIELPIVIFFLIAIIGANPFSWPVIILVYWFSVGSIWAKKGFNN